MQVIITISTDNAAFEAEACETETARILRQLARFAERSVKDMDRLLILDINGNTVGKVEVTE